MADYHVLDKSLDNRNATVRVHLPVPATNNAAGNTYQWCLANDATVDKTSDVPNISGAEQTQLTNGELYEYDYNFRFSSTTLTNAERRSEIRDGNDNMKGVSVMLTEIATPYSDTWNEVLDKYAWYGYADDI